MGYLDYYLGLKASIMHICGVEKVVTMVTLLTLTLVTVVTSQDPQDFSQFWPGGLLITRSAFYYRLPVYFSSLLPNISSAIV